MGRISFFSQFVPVSDDLSTFPSAVLNPFHCGPNVRHGFSSLSHPEPDLGGFNSQSLAVDCSWNICEVRARSRCWAQSDWDKVTGSLFGAFSASSDAGFSWWRSGRRTAAVLWRRTGKFKLFNQQSNNTTVTQPLSNRCVFVQADD